MITSTFYSAAFTVTQYDNKFGSVYFTRKFHTSQDIRINDVTGNANRKYIAQPLIKNELCRRPTVYTTKNYGKRKLAIPGIIDLFQQISIGFQVIDKVKGAIGVCTDFIEMHQQSVMQIDKNGIEILIPAVDEFLDTIDRENKIIYVQALSLIHI